MSVPYIQGSLSSGYYSTSLPNNNKFTIGLEYHRSMITIECWFTDNNAILVHSVVSLMMSCLQNQDNRKRAANNTDAAPTAKKANVAPKVSVHSRHPVPMWHRERSDNLFWNNVFNTRKPKFFNEFSTLNIVFVISMNISEHVIEITWTRIFVVFLAIIWLVPVRLLTNFMYVCILTLSLKSPVDNTKTKYPFFCKSCSIGCSGREAFEEHVKSTLHSSLGGGVKIDLSTVKERWVLNQENFQHPRSLL